MEQRWKMQLSLTFRKGVLGNWGGCCSLPTPVAFPQPQLPFAIHYSDSRTVGDLH